MSTTKREMVTSVQTCISIRSISSANRAGKLLDLLYLDYRTEPLLNFASATYRSSSIYLSIFHFDEKHSVVECKNRYCWNTCIVIQLDFLLSIRFE